MKLTASVIQTSTVLFDTPATVERALGLMKEAAAQGAQHRELPASLRHGDAEGVEDDERADEDGDAGERQQHRCQEGVDGGGRLAGRVGGRLLLPEKASHAADELPARRRCEGRDRHRAAVRP